MKATIDIPDTCRACVINDDTSQAHLLQRLVKLRTSGDDFHGSPSGLCQELFVIQMFALNVRFVGDLRCVSVSSADAASLKMEIDCLF